MCLGINSFDSINNDGAIETTGSVASSETASPMVASIFGGDFSGSTNVETSGQVALLFGDNLSLDGDSNGEVLFGGASSGGGSCGGGGFSLA